MYFFLFALKLSTMSSLSSLMVHPFGKFLYMYCYGNIRQYICFDIGFHGQKVVVCRKTFSRVAAKCVCVQACTVLIVGKAIEKVCPKIRVIL